MKKILLVLFIGAMVFVFLGSAAAIVLHLARESRTFSAVPPPVERHKLDCDADHPHGSQRRCGTSTGICSYGTQTCDDGFWLSCVGAVLPRGETCNGMDDDCDGIVDNGFNLGADAGNCGACSARCPADMPFCRFGKCIVAVRYDANRIPWVRPVECKGACKRSSAMNSGDAKDGDEASGSTDSLPDGPR